MRWREVIYDVYQSLKQNFDDSEITINHVKYWCTIIGNRLLAQHIDKKDSGAFLTVFNNISVTQDTTTKYKYIELPQNVLDFNRDNGIAYISYGYCVDTCTPPFTSVQFCRVTPAEARVLYFTEEEKPTPSNPYFYRVGNRVYLLGIECIDLNCGLEIGLYLTISFDECDMSDEFQFPDELVSVLQRYVFDIGRFVLSIPSTIGVNDGASESVSTNTPKTKLVSVSDTPPQQQQEPQQ